MSGIRKFTRRRKALANHKKAKAKVTILDSILILGLTLTFIGILWGGLSYFYYSGGRPESISHSREGTVHVEHVEPGRPYYMDRAKFAAVLVAIGLISSGLSLAVKHVRKKEA